MTSDRARRLVVAALLLVVAGCGGSPPAPRASPAPSSRPAAPPQPSEACGTPDTPATVFWLAGPGGIRLQAATVGSGAEAAVFVHESGSQGLCGFWAYAAELARTRQVRALLFDQCGYGASTCPGGGAEDGERWTAATTTAVAWARAHGARHVTLIGASFGGIVALHAAAAVRPPVDGVVDLSGELTWNGFGSLPAVRRLRMPVLLAVAPGDRYTSVADMRRVYAAVPARTKRLWSRPTGPATAGTCSPTAPAGPRSAPPSPHGHRVAGDGPRPRTSGGWMATDAVIVVGPGEGRLVPRRYGERTVVKVADADTRGAYAVRENSVPAGFGGVPMHVHREAEEAFYVLDGELTLVTEDGPLAAPAGSFVLVPRGVAHSIANRGVVPVRWLTLISPAWAAGWIEEEGVDPEEQAAAFAKYGLEIVGPPPAL